MTNNQQMDTPESQQIKHINLTHDQLCPWRQAEESESALGLLAGVAVCECDLIAKVREDERRRWDGQSVVLASTIKPEGKQG